MSLEHLIIKPASEAQTHEAQLRNAAYWGVKAGASVEDYLKLNPILQQGVFAHNGRLKYWVLVPQDEPDTTNFYASCQVMAREVLTLHPTQNVPKSGFGHAISFVIVPPEHRGKGYANRFMSLLHSALAPHRYPNSIKAPTPADHSSTVSILYSAVGDYYARCAPSVGESGWSRQSSFVTTWPLSGVKIPPTKDFFPPIELLSESEVATILDSDDSHIPTDLSRLQKKNPTKTYFAFVPTAPLNAYSLTMSKLVPGVLSNTSWGARASGSRDFMTWVLFDDAGFKLIITRIRASASAFPALLGAALQVAQGAQCEGIEIWNVPEHLKEIAQVTGGVTTEREDCVPAFKWYGQEPKTAGADVVWAINER
ncbi:unnamed protein product [Rhizoctonia solani]|uniref:LYC1 C-terminal domain-containing protein n=1 Tax=Rhizoctonia solani TaxID=456999 RepID=A0A8H3B0X4_9AGAM|nr:unnamed protein product [Rhizoctonia solani]